MLMYAEEAKNTTKDPPIVSFGSIIAILCKVTVPGVGGEGLPYKIDKVIVVHFRGYNSWFGTTKRV